MTNHSFLSCSVYYIYVQSSSPVQRHIWDNRREIVGHLTTVYLARDVMDLPLYTIDSRSELSNQGREAYQSFHQAVVLYQVMRQTGHDPQQVLFHDILMWLRDAKVSVDDWNCLMTQTPTKLMFKISLHFPPPFILSQQLKL